jgi:hypothetical protein
MWQQQMRIVNLSDGSNLIPNCQIEIMFLKPRLSKYFLLIKVKNFPLKKKNIKRSWNSKSQKLPNHHMED